MPYKITEVRPELIAQINQSKATVFYVAMGVQLGAAIGELVKMGASPDDIRNAFEYMLTEAIASNRPNESVG